MQTKVLTLSAILAVSPTAAGADPNPGFRDVMLEVLIDQQNYIEKLEARIHEMVKSETAAAQSLNSRIESLALTLQSDYQTVIDWNSNSSVVGAAIANLQRKDLAQRDLLPTSEATANYFSKSEASNLQTSQLANFNFAKANQLTGTIQRYQKPCWVFLGWSDVNQGNPQSEVGRGTYGDTRQSDYIHMTGNVNGDDALFLWTDCGRI